MATKRRNTTNNPYRQRKRVLSHSAHPIRSLDVGAANAPVTIRCMVNDARMLRGERPLRTDCD
jgi:hypothetical protein